MLRAEVMNSSYMSLENVFTIKYLEADLAFKRLDVTDAVYCGQVSPKTSFHGELSLTNFTFVLGVHMLSPARNLSMYSVVVSVDR